MYNIKHKVQRVADKVGVSHYELSRGETEYILKFNNEQDYLIFCWNFVELWGVVWGYARPWNVSSEI